MCGVRPLAHATLGPRLPRQVFQLDDAVSSRLEVGNDGLLTGECPSPSEEAKSPALCCVVPCWCGRGRALRRRGPLRRRPGGEARVREEEGRRPQGMGREAQGALTASSLRCFGRQWCLRSQSNLRLSRVLSSGRSEASPARCLRRPRDVFPAGPSSDLLVPCCAASVPRSRCRIAPSTATRSRTARCSPRSEGRWP